MELTDKVVLITGASSGIGAAIAIYLSKLSAKLVLVGRNENNLRRIALYCEKAKGIKPLTIAADVTEQEDDIRIINETIEQFGSLNVLVNNAGVFEAGGIKNSTMENYDKVMDTNIKSVYQLTMLAVPHLIETKGCIINISCTASIKPNANSLAYNISKAALDHFTKCVALELAKDGIRVNSINPGFVKTNLLKRVGLNDDQMEMVQKNFAFTSPLKKQVEGEEIGALVAYLASEKAKSITGSIYTMDNGSLLQ